MLVVLCSLFFEMDWGKSLSNDRDALQFERENKQYFRHAENMLTGVLKENYRDQIKDATPQNDNNAKMMAELRNVVQMRTEGRRKIEIIEESELVKNKNLETSKEIIHELPTTTSQKEF